MNKKLDRLIGQKAAEKRGKDGALTSFMCEAWAQQKRNATNETQ